MTKRAYTSTAVRYGFTYNNYSAEGEEALRVWLRENSKYAVYQHEEAPSTGTPHLQGYLSLKKAVRMKTLQNRLKDLDVKLSLFVPHGTARENRAYCTDPEKGSNPWEHGDVSVAIQGCRTDLSEAIETLKNESLKDTAIKHPEVFVKYAMGLSKLKQMFTPAPAWREVNVTVLWGPGGVGKTRTAVQYSEDYYFVKTPQNNSLWWDNYGQQKTIIIDDFYGWIKPHDLFRILDGYVLDLPIKGGFVYAWWNKVFITSNLPPEKWYKSEVFENLDKQAYYRRLTEIINMT